MDECFFGLVSGNAWTLNIAFGICEITSGLQLLGLARIRNF